MRHPGNSDFICRRKLRGAALMLMLVILVVGITAILVGSQSAAALKNTRQEKTLVALAQAKDALLGDAVSQSPVTAAGYLRLPDIGFGPPGNTPVEGNAAPSFTGNLADYSVIGKFPWKKLGLTPLQDGQGECLWYAVSGRFKKTPLTDTLNWDTLGQIDVINESGNLIAGNLAALLVSPGPPLDGQNRTLSDPAYTQCGGNYDARNYLDAYHNSDAVSGAVNYFSGSTNNRVASTASNKRFVMTSSGHYNDRFLFVSVDDLFRPIIRRSDFAAQISALMNEAYFQNVAITGAKGTGNVLCSSLGTAANQEFCANWLEMLLLTRLAAPSSITIDGTPTPACARVLVFGGQKTAAQIRLSDSDKSSPANYLETANLAAFAVPVAASSNFAGASTFDADNPGADLLRCLP
jgi:type II secretory pathway pseudopilin PulG